MQGNLAKSFQSPSNQQAAAPDENISRKGSYQLPSPSYTAAIDPKYVADIEANLGRLRLENSNLVSSIAGYESKIGSLDSANKVQAAQLEALKKEVADSNTLKAQIRQLEFELEAKKGEAKAVTEQLTNVRSQLFQITFDRTAFESNLQENSYLKQQQQFLGMSLESLKLQFEEYRVLTNIPAEDLQRKLKAASDNEAVRCCYLASPYS